MANLYKFNPRARSGVIGSLSAKNLIFVGCMGLVILSLWFSGLLFEAVLLAIITGVLVLTPWGGEKLVDVFLVWLAFLGRLLSGKGKRESITSVVSENIDIDGKSLAVKLSQKKTTGEVWFKVTATPEFALRGYVIQDQVLSEWGQALDSIAQMDIVESLTFIEYASPASSGGADTWFRNNLSPRSTEALADYELLLHHLSGISSEHSVFLKVAIKPIKIKDSVALSIADAALQAMKNLSMFSLSPLSNDELETLLSGFCNPLVGIANGASMTSSGGPIKINEVPPLLESIDHFRLGTAYATALWAIELPRRPITADHFSRVFQASLPVQRIWWTKFTPTSPWRAERKLESQRTQVETQISRKQKQGFVPKASEHRELSSINERVNELLAGHQVINHSSFIGVVAPTQEVLTETITRIKSVGGSAGILFRNLGPRSRAAFAELIPELIQ